MKLQPQDAFSESDFTRPQQWWFYRDPGECVHVLFMTRPCRWLKCNMCNLPTMSSTKVEFKHLIDQVDWFCEHVLIPDKFRNFETLTVGNNGSILDPDTFPPSAMFYLMARARVLCPTLQRFSFITRPEYATDAILGSLMEEALTYTDRASGGSSLDIEITVGIEAISAKATKPMKKGFGRTEVEDLAAKLARWNDIALSVWSEGRRRDGRATPPPVFSLRGYFLLKPYPLTDDEAVDDVVAGFEFLAKLKRDYGVLTTMHLNPTYVASGTEVAAAVGRGEDYSPPSVTVIARALQAIRDSTDWADPATPHLCLGLSDEGMAEEGRSFVPPKEKQAEGSLWRVLCDFNEDASVNKRDGFAAIDKAMLSQEVG